MANTGACQELSDQSATLPALALLLAVSEILESSWVWVLSQVINNFLVTAWGLQPFSLFDITSFLICCLIYNPSSLLPFPQSVVIPSVCKSVQVGLGVAGRPKLRAPFKALG